ncbi:MAG: hypothetical protein PVF58_08870 [Candidatus Methanofastidiosia archaeon]|jgi:hypothetical protein
MDIKSFFAKKAIKWGLIPAFIKWKKSVIGTGVMYAHIMRMMQEKYGIEGVKNLNEVMYTIGLDQANELLELLHLEKTVEGCAYTLMAMHRIFGIESKIVQKDKNKIVIHVTHCYWGRQTKEWTKRTCASIASYETGLVKGVLPSATHVYTKKHTLGDAVCELIIALK